VKVTAEQEAALCVLAAGRGITVARLLVESALAGGAESAGVRAAAVAELAVLARGLGRVGTNVNQIAKATNATGETQAGTADALAAVQHVMARLAAVLEELDTSRGPRRVAAS
jgi:hypothetical protein